jgi:predicted PurR-regulated permease PerM
MKHQTITISTETIVKLILSVVGVWFLFNIKHILAVIFFALILSSALDNSIDKLVSKRVPRIISVAFIYLVFLSILGTVGFAIAEPLRTQGQDLIQNFPQYYELVTNSIEQFTQASLPDLANQPALSNINYSASQLFQRVIQFFGGITSFVLILVLTFYMSIETNALKKAIYAITPNKYDQRVGHLLDKIQNKIGDWLRGQLILSFVVSVIAYIGLSMLGVKYALILAILAGLGEFIPYIGPALAAILAIFVAFTTAPIQAVFVAVFYGILQALENHVLVPQIMRKAIGINPILIICALLIGIRVGGVMGGLLAIPTATALSVIIDDIQEHNK